MITSRGVQVAEGGGGGDNISQVRGPLRYEYHRTMGSRVYPCTTSITLASSLSERGFLMTPGCT
jgi:hypothetical protein